VRRQRNGISLHAAVRCAADDRQALEQLCRCITRPAMANERVQTNAAGQVALNLKIPWRDGTTHLVMSPLEFMQLSIEGPVCDGQIRWLYVCSGSTLARWCRLGCPTVVSEEADGDGQRQPPYMPA
jgi:hypothetical protein